MNEEFAKSAEAWENRELGADRKFAKKAPEFLEKQIDDAIGLRLISIRLPDSLIDAFKLIADIEGVGYQPLMRDVLKRFAYSELKAMVRTIRPEDLDRAKNLIPEEVETERRAA